MILFVVVTCWMGIAAGAAVATAAGGVEDDEEIESLTVFEGGNLTISIHIEKWDENPQILLIRRKGFSKELIAQIICHNGACAQSQKWRSEVSLKSDGENVTLSLMNVSYNQTGLYEVHKPSSKWHGNKIYNVIVCQLPLSTINPEKTSSAKYSDSTAGISVVAVGVVLVVLALVVFIGAVIYWKHKKANKSEEMPQEIDAEASRRHRSHSDHASCLSLLYYCKLIQCRTKLNGITRQADYKGNQNFISFTEECNHLCCR